MKKQLLVLLLAIAMIFSVFTACSGDDEIISAIVLDQPTKANYVVGETFDFTGATLELTMKDGSTKVVEITASMLSEIPTFSEPGQKTIAVTYTEGDATLTAYIKVTVTGEKVTTLGVAQENAKNSLAALYATLIFKAPDGYPTKDSVGNECPDYATPAKAVYDKAIEDIAAATDAKTVYIILGRAQSELTQLDNYVDFYATVKWQEIEDKFVDKYAGNESLYLDDYVGIVVLKNGAKNLVLRARSLDRVDERFDEWLADDAENKTVVQKIAEELLKIQWTILMPTTTAGDEKDATMVAYDNILTYMAEAQAVIDEGNTEFKTLYNEQMAAFELSNIAHLLTDTVKESGIYTQVLTPYISGPAGAKVLNLNNSVDKVEDRIEELKDARKDANEGNGASFSWDAQVAALLFDIGKDGEGNYNAIVYDSALSDRVYALIEDIQTDWIDVYHVDEPNYRLIDGYADLLGIKAKLDKIEDAMANPALPTLDIDAQIILGVSEDPVAEQRVIAENFAKEAGIPVDAQYYNGTKDVYVIPNYDRLLKAEERLADLAEAKTKAEEANVGLKALIGKIPTKLLYNQYTEVNAAEAAYIALTTDYNLVDGFELFEGEATTAATLEANLKAVIGTDDLATYNAAIARRKQLNDAAENANADGGLVDLIEAIGNVTLDSVNFAGNGKLDVAKAEYTRWTGAYSIDEQNAALILGTETNYKTYTDAVAKYADLKAKLDALKEAINALPNSLEAATSVGGKISDARSKFIELCAANSDSYYNGDDLIDPATTHAVTYKHLTNSTTTLDGALYVKLVALEAQIFESNLNGHINGIIGQINDLYKKYYNAIGGMTRQNDVAALQAAQADLNNYFSNTLRGYMNANTFADAVMQGSLPSNLLTSAFAQIDELFKNVEPSFQQAVRYIITGDATDGYNLTIYADGSYVATDMLDKNKNVVTTYNTITLTSQNIILNGFTANEVIVGAAATSISAYSLASEPAPVSLTVNGCQITTLTITAPATINAQGTNTVTAINAVAATVLNNMDQAKLSVTLDGIKVDVIATGATYVEVNGNGNVFVTATTVDIDIAVAEGTEIVPHVELDQNTTGTIDSNKDLSGNSATGATEVKVNNEPVTGGNGGDGEEEYSPVIPGMPAA